MHSVVHIILHFALPGFVARMGWPKRWLWAWACLVMTNLVDLDHLFADPIYDPSRCSIGYHPLHSYPALGIYVLLIGFAKTRVFGVGLTLHMILDGTDCLWMG